MRVLCGTLLVLILAAQPASAVGPLWLPVTHTTKRTGASFYPEVVQTRAEQATVTLEKPDRKSSGDPAPSILQTRHLQFVCQGATYLIPDPFAEDLPWLGVDSSVRASIHGKDTVFTMIGDSGLKAYTVHFHFRDSRFFQRILDYTETHTIVIRTNSATPPP